MRKVTRHMDAPHDKTGTDPHVTWASRLAVALTLYFAGRSIYLLVTEGPNPLATSITLMWTSLLVLLWLRQPATEKDQ